MNKKVKKNKLMSYFIMIRIDKPIGIFLLMWPTLSSLWLANKKIPPVLLLLIFSIGVIIMRSAGCIINDCIDYRIDKYVKRTKNRPLTSGLISLFEAKIIFIVLLLIALFLVIMTNILTIILSIIGLILSCIYPFMKRYTNLAQCVLGITFSWSIPMAWVASGKSLSLICFLLFFTNVFFTIMYDTQYAMVDKDDDLKIGIKSMAILLGNFNQFVIALLQIIILIFMFMIGKLLNFKNFFYFTLLIIIFLFIYQQYLMSKNTRKDYFNAFLNNNYVGLVFFIDIILNNDPFVNYF